MLIRVMDNIKSLFIFVLIFQFGASANAQKNSGLSFRFFACKEIREKNLLKSILIIDSVKKDTVNAGSLLVGDSIILSYDNQYSFLLVGTGKWDYFVKNEIVRKDFPAKLTICYNAHQKKMRRKCPVSIYSSSKGFCYPVKKIKKHR